MSLYMNVEKKLKNYTLNINLDLKDEKAAFLGGSGSGKTMTLKLIAGIERPDRGKIILNEKTIFDSEKNIDVKTRNRKIGLLFQNYALFPNMTVKKNVIVASKTPSPDEFFRKFRIDHILDKYPDKLSGGEKQRVALAGIFASKPDILMLDEPFSALDTHLRFKLEDEIRKIINTFDKTVIIVTHDKDEAYRLSDKIAVFNNGIIDEFGDKDTIFTRPQKLSTATLISKVNCCEIQTTDDNLIIAGKWNIKFKASKKAYGHSHMAIKYDDIKIGDGENSFWVNVTGRIDESLSTIISAKPENCKDTIYIRLPKNELNSLNSRLLVNVPSEKIMLLNNTKEQT